ncbi:cupin domain-containing protein [Draconibacterium sediminis]|uniref:Cupin n=1 Tax=Draconibacterium sediminis TaxID=1544798 RepID=A0A0D8J7E2_9BACT|nr:cupin domain-containing protein [Draconibacterium sediminis]KJF42895.1 cupin [Draconibacterium sediminis]
MFTKSNFRSYKSLLPGVKMRPLAFEEQSIMCEFELQKGSELPPHSHPYEQTGYLLSGRLNFRIDNEWVIAEPGDSWCIPSTIEHQVEVLEDAKVLEVFTPIRPDYLPDEKER